MTTAPLSIYLPPKRYRSNGQRDKALDFWTNERLAAVKDLCQRHASWDDFAAVFPGVGMARVMIAMRYIIATQCRGAVQ